MTAAPQGTVHRVGDLHVELFGAGRPVLLLHGNSEDLHYFDAQIPVLARRRLVIAMDSRAHGRSGRGEGPLTIPRLADDAADVIAALAGDGATPDRPARCDVVGFSDGANIAIELALRHPGLVRSLVLNAGNIDPSGLTPWTLRGSKAVYALLTAAAAFSARARARREVWSLMLNEPHIPPGRLAVIDVPALVLVGDRDLIRPEHSALIARSVPRAELLVVPSADHFLLAKRPDVATPVIERFLDSV